MRSSTVLASVYVALGILVIGLVVFWLQYTDAIDLEALGAWVEGKGARGLVGFGLAYTALSMVGVSKVAMTVLAGTIFTFFEALAVTVLASTAAAILGFYLARYFRSFIVDKVVRPRRGEARARIRSVVDKIEEHAERRGFYIVAILRLSLVPLMFLSYTSGLVRRLAPREFAAAIFVTNIYVNLVYILVGAALTRSLPLFAAAIALLILFMQTPRLVERLSKE
jgi:uncharacterized membrane protein YdjX (TVP38/TMEM64 family)